MPLVKTGSQDLIKQYEMQRESRPRAEWEVIYGIKSFFLTRDEKDYLIKALEGGARYVEINGHIFTDKFLFIGLSTYAQERAKERKLMGK